MGREMGQDPIEYLERAWGAKPPRDEDRENDKAFG